MRWHYRFVRGDQYAIALALLHEGKVVLGVLACPNLPLASIGCNQQHSSSNEVGCLFFAKVGDGAYMQALDGSTQTRVGADRVLSYLTLLLMSLTILLWPIVLLIVIIIQVHVSAVDNPEEASFFESFEAAHSSHDLSSSIAEVMLSHRQPFALFYYFFFSLFIVAILRLDLQTFLWHYDFMNRNSVSKHRQSELTAKQNMELCPEETALSTCVSPTKDTVKKYGTMLLAVLLLLVCAFLSFWSSWLWIISFCLIFQLVCARNWPIFSWYTCSA